MKYTVLQPAEKDITRSELYALVKFDPIKANHKYGIGDVVRFRLPPTDHLYIAVIDSIQVYSSGIVYHILAIDKQGRSWDYTIAEGEIIEVVKD